MSIYKSVLPFTRALPMAACGTSGITTMKANYTDLVKCFGLPDKVNEISDKVSAEWVLSFIDGSIVTIYDWKTSKGYCGASGIDYQDNIHWHIGGTGKSVNAAIVLVDALSINEVTA